MGPTFARCLLLALLAAALAGCPSQRKTSDKDLNIITRAQLHAMMNDSKQRASLTIIDVHKPKPYADGHLPGSINIEVIDLRKSDPRLAEAKTIVVYGSGDPNDLLSWAAAKKLIALGYSNVYDFRGGMEEWLGQRESTRPLIDNRMRDKVDMY